ncbi:cell division protein PerM [Nocardia stercoris]|uniref:Uncharacterized protein n=1 Tax=Nocardia stercoris TaxID=2483361 RepID=A0A3M2KUJ1_9NOCA|nr:DUF6350 family protein [Nocardia stercoris]RMI28120.1 hypothetical protein EBN03_31550 [Nocardia stercoris]
MRPTRSERADGRRNRPAGGRPPTGTTLTREAREAAARRTGEPDAGPAVAALDALFAALTPERAKVLLIVAARTSSFTMVTVVTVVIGALLCAHSPMTGASGAIAAGWLAVHQVPVTIGTTTISMLPLVPTALVVWLTGRDCARAVTPDAMRSDLAWIVGAALFGPLLITSVCLAVAQDAATVLPLQPPTTLLAFAWVGGLHFAGAAVGIAARLAAIGRRPPAWRQLTAGVPPWVESGARIGVTAVGRLLLAGVVVTIGSLVWHCTRLGDAYAAAGNVGGVIGLTLLSIGYLPNLMIAATGVLVGSEVRIGDGGLSLFAVTDARLPAVPVTVAVPSGPAPTWWAVLLLIPVLVAGAAGVECARAGDDIRSPRTLLTATAVASVVLLVLGSLAGGELGAFGSNGPEIPLFPVVTVAWLLIGGGVGLFAARRLAPRFGRRAPGSADGYDDEDYADYDDERYEDYDEYDAAGEYETAGEPFGDDEYEVERDGYRAPRYRDYADPATRPAGEGVMDGELLDDESAATGRSRDGYPDADGGDIVDAEVVEADLPDRGERDGR